MKKLLLSLMMLLVAAAAKAEFPYVTTSLSTSGSVQWYYLQFDTDTPGFLYSANVQAGQSEIRVARRTYDNTDAYKWCFVQESGGKIALMNKAKMQYLSGGLYFSLETVTNPNVCYIEPIDNSSSFYIYYGIYERYYLDWDDSDNTLMVNNWKSNTLCAIEADSQYYTTPSGEVVFSNLDVQEQYCSFTCAYNGNESHTLRLFINGSRVEYSSPYNILRTYEEQTIQVKAEVYFTDQIFPRCTVKDYVIPAKEGVGPSGEIVFSDLEVFDDHCTFGATYTGNEEHQLYLYLGYDELIENPYSVPRTDEESFYEVTARVVFTDPYLEPIEDVTGYYIPPLSDASPIVTTTSPTKLPIHWYQLKVNDKYVFYDPDGWISNQIQLTETESTENNFLWCFVKASSGKTMIYNRAAKKYLEQGQYLESNIDNSYLSYIEEDSDNYFYIKYYHSGDNITWYLYETNGVLGSIGGKRWAHPFRATEVLVEEDLVPVTDVALTPYNVYTPNNIQTDPAEDYNKLFDKNKSTKWCVDNSTGSWETIWVDFKSNEAFTPTSYTMTTGNDTQSWKGRNPKKWKIYAKTKESDSWTTIVDVSDGAAAGLGTSNTTDYTFDIVGATKKYQYFRFEVSEVRDRGGWQNNHYVFQLAELALSGYTSANTATPGDVNGDGVVSGADVTALYNVLLDNATPAGNADVNGDGVVSGADVTALYNILLN